MNGREKGNLLKEFTDPCAKAGLAFIYFWTWTEPHQVIWSSTQSLASSTPKPLRKGYHIFKFFVEGHFLAFLVACSAFQPLSKTNKFCFVSLRTVT